MATIRARGKTFQVRWRQDDKEVSETFSTRAQAVKFRGLVDASGQRSPEGWIPRHGFVNTAKAGPTLAEWFDRAIKARTRPSDQTKADYRRDFDRHFPNWLAVKPIGEITHEDAGNWFNELKATPSTKRKAVASDGSVRRVPITQKTVHNVHGLVSSVMKDAQRNGLITANPFEGLGKDLDTGSQEEMVFLTPEEFALLRSCFIEHYQPFLTFLYATGLRFSEATALGPEHVDLHAGAVTVARAWKKSPGGVVLGKPKTKRSKRTVSINGPLVDLIKPLVVDAEGRRGRREDEPLVFLNKSGERIRNVSLYTHQWMPTVEKAVTLGLGKRPRIHDLRHSHASLLLASGQSMMAVSRRLGHSSYKITDERYAHLLPEVDERMLVALDRVPMP